MILVTSEKIYAFLRVSKIQRLAKTCPVSRSVGHEVNRRLVTVRMAWWIAGNEMGHARVEDWLLATGIGRALL